jgi:methenyltetrahydrofolate cyclohydrolase
MPATPARLIDVSVRDFVESVADANAPVPAGGSVAAMTGAASAALLALVCGVLERKRGLGLGDAFLMARRLQGECLALVDEDADAFRAFLDAKREPDGDVAAAMARTSSSPLRIGRSCLELLALSDQVEVATSGPMLADVRAARHLARAALDSALDIAQTNLSIVSDPARRDAIQVEIGQLRHRAGKSG